MQLSKNDQRERAAKAPSSTTYPNLDYYVTHICFELSLVYFCTATFFLILASQFQSIIISLTYLLLVYIGCPIHLIVVLIPTIIHIIALKKFRFRLHGIILALTILTFVGIPLMGFIYGK